MLDEDLDGPYFLLNPLCNLGFLYIFLAYFRLIWLFCRYTNDKWRSERFLGVKKAYFGKLKIFWQQAGAAVPIICQENRISALRHWKAEDAASVIRFLRNLAYFGYSEALD